MTASYGLIRFQVWPLPETAMGILFNCLEGALPHTPRTNDLPRTPAVATVTLVVWLTQ